MRKIHAGEKIRPDRMAIAASSYQNPSVEAHKGSEVKLGYEIDNPTFFSKRKAWTPT